MGFMIHGDDELIKHQKGMAYVLRAVILLFVLFLGFVTIMPHSRTDVRCMFIRHPVISNRVFSVNIPIPPLSCHG